MPFEDSRRLLGPNLFFPSTGAVLDVTGAPVDEDLVSAWRARVGRATAAVGWPMARAVVRPHAGGTQLALEASADQLFLATEINEWALCASLLQRDPARYGALEATLQQDARDNAPADSPAAGVPPVLDEHAALERFARLGALEARPALARLLRAAEAHGLPALLDDTTLTLGAGVGSRDFALSALPEEPSVPWSDLSDIPTAVVTGSNGKTTTVRLLAACARAAGWHVGYNCTDGVFLDEAQLESGDYSGPAGARRVLRERTAQAAILETARGGILRRGMAVTRASVALVTNVSADHFGEWGIDDLAAIAETKLAVAATVRQGGLLVLNADDANLREQSERLEMRFGVRLRLGWFSSQPDSALLAACRVRGDLTCGVIAGRLSLSHGQQTHDLGALVDLPLAMGGLATYNVANLAGAALGALALGITPVAIRTAFARFGGQPLDNPGRLMRYERGGATVLIDYAHNPEGLRGLLEVASHLRRPGGRLGLILGQAGNRQDADVSALVQVAVGFRPDCIVIKETEGYLRGREVGEIPRLIRTELLRCGFPDSMLRMAESEVDAAHQALDWARAGDVVALPLHTLVGRRSIVAELSGGAAAPGSSGH